MDLEHPVQPTSSFKYKDGTQRIFLAYITATVLQTFTKGNQSCYSNIFIPCEMYLSMKEYQNFYIN